MRHLLNCTLQSSGMNRPMIRIVNRPIIGQFTGLTRQFKGQEADQGYLRSLVCSPVNYPIIGQFIGPLVNAIQIYLNILLNRLVIWIQTILNCTMNLLNHPMNCLVPLIGPASIT